MSYPIHIPPSAPPTTFVIASQLGLEMNCDLMTGLNRSTGAAAADDAAKINNAMAGATPSKPIILVLDGACATSGLFLPAVGGWGIIGFGEGTGFFQKAASNNDVIHNGSVSSNVPSDPGGTAPARGSGVILRDFFLNGNRGNGTNGNSTSGDPRGLTGSGDTWYYGVNLTSLDHIQISGLRFYNISAYNLRLSNCGHWSVDKCHFENALPGDPVTPQNSDGVHVSGPSNDGCISNSFFRTGDDAIALNAPEGYGGNIVRIAVTNCTSLQSQTMMRIYSNGLAAANVSGVAVSNYIGSANVFGFLLGVEAPHSPTVADSIDDISFINCQVTAPAFCCTQDNIGRLSFKGCRSTGATTSQGLVLTSTNPHTISSLEFANNTIERTSSTAGGGLLDMRTGSFSAAAPAVTVKRCKVNGHQIVDLSGTSITAAPALITSNSTSTVQRLYIDSVDATNIAALGDSTTLGRISAIAGAGVLPTGWALPAAIMANWTPYVDSVSSLPSYKNASGSTVAL